MPGVYFDGHDRFNIIERGSQGFFAIDAVPSQYVTPEYRVTAIWALPAFVFS
jgi:hypothetical protein